jgi:flagellar basal-body rod modification protein FlgD
MISQIASGEEAFFMSASKQSASIEEALGRDAFLNLLITQIRFQDPLKPLEDKEFIAQLAQFSSLEQMQQVNDNLLLLAQMQSISQASALIGKQITTLAGAGGEVIQGRVEAVLFEGGQSWLMVGDEKVNPADVTRVES